MAIYIGTKKLTSSQATEFKKSISQGKSGIEAIKTAKKTPANISKQEITKTIIEEQKPTASSIGLTGEDVFQLTQQAGTAGVTTQQLQAKAIEKQLISSGISKKEAAKVSMLDSSIGFAVVSSPFGREVASTKAAPIVAELRRQQLQQQTAKKTSISTLTLTAKPSLSLYTPSAKLSSKASELEIKSIRSSAEGNYLKAMTQRAASFGLFAASDITAIPGTLIDVGLVTSLVFFGTKIQKQKKEELILGFKQIPSILSKSSPGIPSTKAESFIVLTAGTLGLEGLFATRGAFQAAKASKAASIAKSELLVESKAGKLARFPGADIPEIKIPKTQKSLTGYKTKLPTETKTPLSVQKIDDVILKDLSKSFYTTKSGDVLSGLSGKTSKVKNLPSKLPKTPKYKFIDIEGLNKKVYFPGAETPEILIPKTQKSLIDFSKIKKFKPIDPTIKDLSKSFYVTESGDVLSGLSGKTSKIKNKNVINIKSTITKGDTTIEFSRSFSFMDKKGQVRLANRGNMRPISSFITDETVSSSKIKSTSNLLKDLKPSSIISDTPKATRIVDRVVPSSSRYIGAGLGIGTFSSLGIASLSKPSSAYSSIQTNWLKETQATDVGITSIYKPATIAGITPTTAKTTSLTPAIKTTALVTGASSIFLKDSSSTTKKTKTPKYGLPKPEFDFNLGGGKRSQYDFRIGKQKKSKYTPSVIASTFSIYGKAPKGVLSGLEFRPLIK